MLRVKWPAKKFSHITKHSGIALRKTILNTERIDDVRRLLPSLNTNHLYVCQKLNCPKEDFLIPKSTMRT